MKVLSVNVGRPKDLMIGDRLVPTGIIKTPVEGPVRLRTLNLDGDQQADLTVHGGVDKAVYLYPSEHYLFWRDELGISHLPWGAFGENLTVEGIAETDIAIGDRLGVGTTIPEISQPRLPCFKLAGKFQREDILKRFLDSRRTGFYARVIQEAELQAGDSIMLLERDPIHVTIREITDLYVAKHPERNRLERVLSVRSLATSWRNHFISSLPGQ